MYSLSVSVHVLWFGQSFSVSVSVMWNITGYLSTVAVTSIHGCTIPTRTQLETLQSSTSERPQYTPKAGVIYYLGLLFVFKFHGNRPPGSEWNDALFCRQKFENAFLASFCDSLAEDAKRLQCHASHTSPCTVSPQWVATCRSYSRRSDFVRSQYAFRV